MRIKHSLLVIAATIMVAPAFLHSQFGREGRGGGSGGFGGGGFGQPDPNKLFDMMSKGKDTINRSDLDPRMQGMFDRFAEMSGAKNGSMSRSQFVGGMEKMSSSMKMSSNARPPEGSSGTPPVVMMQGGRDGGGRDGGGRESRGGPSSFGGPPPMGTPPMGTPTSGTSAVPNQMEDRRAEEFFNRSDRNRDGMLSYEELSDRFKPEREKYDTNNDGFISLDEYKKYIGEIFSQYNQQRPERRDGSPSTPENNDPRQNGPVFNIAPAVEEKEEEIRRPTLFRVGKLPKELPSWFEELDKDVDGQVGLYEWRRDSRDLYEFEGMDFNADGLLTPEEVLKFFKLTDDDKKKVASNGRSSAYAPSGRSSQTQGGGGGGGDWANRWGTDTSSSSDKKRGDTGSNGSGRDNKGGAPIAGPGGFQFQPKGGMPQGQGGFQFPPKGGDTGGGRDKEKAAFGGFGKERKKN